MRERWFLACMWLGCLAWGCGSGNGGQTASTGGTGGTSGSDGACPANLPSDADCSSTTPSYKTDIAPLVSARCLECHYEGNGLSGVSLTTQMELSATSSLALTKVYRCEMPPSDQAQPLSESERQLLMRYLVCGAPDN